MDQQAAYRAAREMPEGAQILYAEFAEKGSDYPCTYEPDVVYADYEGLKRSVQIIAPVRNGYTFPLVVFVQGSAWRPQNVYAALPNLSRIAAKGYVMASVEIRDTDVARYPAALEDIKCAIRFMRSHAEKYGIDPRRVAVWGDSSGGHLSLMTGFTPGEHANGLYPDQSDDVCAVVDYYGVTDILTLGQYNDILDHNAADAPEGLLLGGPVQERQELARQASPLHQNLDRPLPPCLIVHGDRDSVVHVSQSIELYKALKEHGQQVWFYKVAGAEHGPGVWSPQVLDVTERFLAAFLHAPVMERTPFQHEQE
ncbi:alpha/beta hydrolase [Paenibacillus glufosinatiresistens]|uniref:alpha/beta hydrolase n=1 Tax=Paenibacillus glufosinatiresistens TaxID=3070657 RepID=UPI00286E158B|nr:alpha/beta hydrolase [Paenibacillus sp. YX.27]